METDNPILIIPFFIIVVYSILYLISCLKFVIDRTFKKDLDDELELVNKDFVPPPRVKRVSAIVTNCPNCGAPVNGDRCEYCGSFLAARPKRRLYLNQEEIKNPTTKEEKQAVWELIHKPVKPTSKTCTFFIRLDGKEPDFECCGDCLECPLIQPVNQKEEIE